MDVPQTLTLAETKGQYTATHCAMAAAALLLYDYIVTLGQESRYIWTDVRAGYAAIFLINRLNMLCMAIYMIMAACSFHALTSCKQIALLWDVVTISTLLVWACVSTLRVYAISNRNVSLSATTAALAVVPIGLNIFSYVKSGYYLFTYGAASTACLTQNTFSMRTQYEFVILSRVSLIVSDVMVLVLTWWQLYGALRISRQGHSRSALAILLLRDNTSYFVLFLLINVIQMITLFVLDNSFNPIPTFMFPFTCIVISRLILNLRRLSSAMRSPMHARSDITSPRSTVPSSFHSSLLSTVMFGPNSQGSQGGQIPPVPPASPSRSPESALESGHIAVREHVMDDIVEEDEGEQEDEDAE